MVEYDADSEDDKWLENINRGQDRLSHQKFELMIWKLELANSAANDRTLTAAGSPPPPPLSTSPCNLESEHHKEPPVKLLRITFGVFREEVRD